MSNVMSPRTGKALLDVILYADRFHDAYIHYELSRIGLIDTDRPDTAKTAEVLNKWFPTINWTKRESVLPLVQMFEKSIRGKRCGEIIQKKFGEEVDTYLRGDGYTIKEGRIVRLRH